MLKSMVLNANKEFIVFNWIKSKVWHDKDMQESFCDTLEDFRTMQYVDNDITVEQVKAFLHDYIEHLQTDRGLSNFIDKLKFTCIKHSFKDLMTDSELNFRSKKELSEFINYEIHAVLN